VKSDDWSMADDAARKPFGCRDARSMALRHGGWWARLSSSVLGDPRLWSLADYSLDPLLFLRMPVRICFDILKAEYPVP